MSVTEGEPTPRETLVDRVKSLLTKPSATWDRIEAEPATVAGLYRNYIAWLALVSPLAFAIGSVVFQHGPVLSALVAAAVLYLFWLVGAFVVALMIAAVAPRFGGENNRIQAMKVAAYAFTPSMLSGVFAIFPPLAVLGVLGFYSFYLLWAGLPKLMKVSEERRLGFYAVVLVLMLAIGMLSGFLIAPLMAVDRLTPR